MLAAALPPRGVLVIGGNSGAGKSTLATAVLDLLGPAAVKWELELAYLGWRGLEAGTRGFARALGRALCHGRADLTTFDWLAMRPGPAARLLHPARLRGPVVIEGVGADVALGRYADVVVRVEAPGAERRRRVDNRDGYWGDLWQRWAADEQAQRARAGGCTARQQFLIYS